jgi:hypothetical protein
MPTLNSTVRPPSHLPHTHNPPNTPQIFHAYIYGTSFWYLLRGLCRIYDPTMVVGWFRPPVHSHLTPNDLELYNVRNDGWCLITLGLILLGLAGAQTSRVSQAVVAATVFHHVTTGIGAYGHYKMDTHYNTSMGIGVWANVWLALSGAVTLASLGSGVGEKRLEHVGEELKKKAR